MQIVDYIVGDGELVNFSFVLVEDNEKNVEELKAMGCSDTEIQTMRCDKDKFLNVFLPLHNKGYVFSPKMGGFLRKEGVECGLIWQKGKVFHT